MLSVSANVSGTIKQICRMYLTVFVICAFLVGLAFVYLVFKYGWSRVVQALSAEEAKSLAKWLLLVPLLGVAAYLVERLIQLVIGSRRTKG